MKVNLLLTFDYEIFFGENFFSDEEVLLIPSEKMVVQVNRPIKLVFFVDIAYLQILEKQRSDLFKKFIDQLQAAKQAGHELQFHYHPHWYDSHWSVEEGKWIFDLTNFSYSLQVKNLGLQK